MLRKLKQWVKILGASPGAEYHISADDVAITCTHNGTVSRITWTELAAIRVIPLRVRVGADLLFWTLSSNAGDIAFPADARGAPDVIRRLVNLPGFDTVRYQNADEASLHEGMVVWRKSSSI